MGNSVISDISGGGGAVSGAFVFKGNITIPADFPTLVSVINGWTYVIIADVTDNDPTRTNTGQSFLIGDIIAWNGTNWSDITGIEIFIRNGTTITPINVGDLLDLLTGLLKVNNILPSSGEIITLGNGGVASVLKIPNSSDVITHQLNSEGDSFLNGSVGIKTTTPERDIDLNSGLCEVMKVITSSPYTLLKTDRNLYINYAGNMVINLYQEDLASVNKSAKHLIRDITFSDSYFLTIHPFAGDKLDGLTTDKVIANRNNVSINLGTNIANNWGTE